MVDTNTGRELPHQVGVRVPCSSGRYLAAIERDLYRNKYVYLPDYVDVVDVPVVPFALGSYWSSHYSGRPWYRRRAYWTDYWTSHERAATQTTIDRSAARIGRAATRNGAIAEGQTSRAGQTPRAGVAERVTREQNAAQIRSAREAQGRAPALISIVARC